MRTKSGTVLPAALLAAGQLLAGGFFPQLGNPEASPEARKRNAALVVKAAGGHDPAGANLTPRHLPGGIGRTGRSRAR